MALVEVISTKNRVFCRVFCLFVFFSVSSSFAVCPYMSLLMALYVSLYQSLKCLVL